MTKDDRLESLNNEIEKCSGRKECVKLIHAATKLKEKTPTNFNDYAPNQKEQQCNPSAET